MRSSRARLVVALALTLAVVSAACSSHASSARSPTSPSTSEPAPPAGDSNTLLAVREVLTADPRSPVVHDTEVMALAAHAGRMFAATDQWEYGGPDAAGQVLVKDSAHAPWRVFERTQSVRVQALDSFPIPSDQGLGAGHALLVVQAIIDGRSEIQWLVDGASAFSPAAAFTLASSSAEVRSFGAHVDHGVWSVYAGVNPTGILRGTWSPAAHRLQFDPTPELVGAAPGAPGVQTRKVTGFADCGGALYTSLGTKLYRRNDGAPARGMPRWALVYQAPPVGPHNSGLRGLSCVDHDGAPALLVSTEGTGDVYRLANLPRGQVRAGALTATLEFAPQRAIRQFLATQGTNVPTKGAGSIAYVIAAYNNFETLTLGGTTRQLFGIEWAYAGPKHCPATRTCGPVSFNAVHFDAAACFAIRTDSGAAVSYAVRCLGGPTFRPSTPGDPIRGGQVFVSIRTIQPSPFGDGALYFGGYDCNFSPADGTAWVATADARDLRLDRD